MYCGTFNGVFLSIDGGRSWDVFGNTIPNSFVADMTIQEREKDLIAVTHGRGIYKIDLEPIYRYMKSASKGTQYLYTSDAMLPPRDASGAKPNLNNYENVYFNFYSEFDETMELQILSSDQDPIFSKNVDPIKGLNTYSWDFVIGPNEDKNPFLFNFWVLAKPGKYTIHLKGKNVDIESEFDILEAEK